MDITPQVQAVRKITHQVKGDFAITVNGNTAEQEAAIMGNREVAELIRTYKAK